MNTLEAVVQERVGDPLCHTTEAELDAQVDRETAASIAYYSRRERDEISRRLGELDREWSVERVMEMKIAGVSFLGVVFGLLGRKRWLLLSGMLLPFLFQQSMEGSSAATRMLRRFGLRTRAEIDRERYALKALRGDFADAGPESDPQALLHATMR